MVVTLGNPRDKFWGMILSLAPEGLSMSGIELASFEDLVVMVKDGEPFTPAVVFFHMHRIERIELDLSDGNLPSLSQRFSAKTGLKPAATFGSSIRKRIDDCQTHDSQIHDCQIHDSQGSDSQTMATSAALKNKGQA